MDPYLERPSLWPSVHHRLITAMCDQIVAQLAPQYAADITPYVTFESIEITPRRRAVVPDISILREETHRYAEAAIAELPLTVAAEMPIETRYGRLEIRTTDGEELVTAIELLSPANKRPGEDGADAYEKKRREIFMSDVHLIEIDLLRAGRRPKLTKPLPDRPYFIFLSRAEQRPQLQAWPIALRAPLPVIPVPLRRPDPDITLDVAAALRQCYRSARYDRRIDYREPPPEPELSEDDLAWVDGHLRTTGLRS
jgi:hypothetical protein